MSTAYRKMSAMMAVILAVIMVLAVGANAGPFPSAAPINPEFEAVVIEKAQGSHVVQTTSTGHALGYIPPPIDFRYLKPGGTLRAKQATTALTALPAVWDWRTSPGYNALTSVKNQGSCGSCWAFGNIGAIEARYKISTPTHIALDLSENNMMSLDTTAYRACHWPWLWSRCSGGNTALAQAYALGLMLPTTTPTINYQKGLLTEGNDPYNQSGSYIDPKCSYNTRPAPAVVVNGTRWIYGDTVLMKQAIYKYGPLVSAFFMDNSFMYAGMKYYNPNWFQGTNHEILIVGWNDSITWPDGSGSGAWIVKNSWGSTWGTMGGYFYICYGSGSIGSDSLSYTGVRARNAKENFYAEDLGGWLTNVGYNGLTSAYGATVFKPKVTGEKLTAVEFFVPFFKMPYTIKIWSTVTHPSSTQIACSAQLGATITGTAQEPGYYEIAVPVPPTLTAGREYAIEIKFTSTASGYYWPIPCATAISGVVLSTAGQGNATSYIRGNSTGAFDRYTTYLPNIRARTLRP